MNLDSFLPAEINAAFLWAQLEALESIQQKRLAIWNRYSDFFKTLESDIVRIPDIPCYATNNAHMFYLLLPDKISRDRFILAMFESDIMAVFHYLPLHHSPFYHGKHDGRNLAWAISYSDRLVRLPLYCDLLKDEQERICRAASAVLGSLQRVQ